MDRISVIIACGGSSQRMNGINKITAELRGIPVIVHSLLAFETLPCVTEIIPVCREEDVRFITQMTAAHGMLKVLPPVCGGNTRQQSVLNGFACVSEDAEFVAVHDGARPLVSRVDILSVFDAAKEHGGAILGVPVKDTIKITDNNGFVTETPDRAALFAAQTPQVFDRKVYAKAVQEALRRGREYPDDCMMVEETGVRVFVAHGSYKNIKITTPEDLRLAQALLKE